jgi:hypothetical protein
MNRKSKSYPGKPGAKRGTTGPENIWPGKIANFEFATRPIVVLGNHWFRPTFCDVVRITGEEEFNAGRVSLDR